MVIRCASATTADLHTDLVWALEADLCKEEQRRLMGPSCPQPAWGVPTCNCVMMQHSAATHNSRGGKPALSWHHDLTAWLCAGLLPQEILTSIVEWAVFYDEEAEDCRTWTLDVDTLTGLIKVCLCP